MTSPEKHLFSIPEDPQSESGLPVLMPDEMEKCLHTLKIPVLRQFLEADPALANARDENGWMALHLVARINSYPEKKLEATNMLLSAGTDINATAKWKYGIWKGLDNVVIEAVEKGFLAKDPSDDAALLTPWQIAAVYNYRSLAMVMLEAENDEDENGRKKEEQVDQLVAVYESRVAIQDNIQRMRQGEVMERKDAEFAAKFRRPQYMGGLGAAMKYGAEKPDPDENEQ